MDRNAVWKGQELHGGKRVRVLSKVEDAGLSMAAPESRQLGLFVHIPKCAGMSVRAALEQAAPETTSHLPNTQARQMLITRRLPLEIKRLAVSLVQRTPLRSVITVAGHPSAALLAHTVPDFFDRFRFTFCRNPYERFASAYRYFKRNQPELTLDEFIRIGRVRLQPQNNFVYKGGHLLVDFVGRVENIEDDFAAVCRRLGIGSIPLPRLNTTDSVAAEILSDRACRYVRSIYSADFETFGYDR